MDDSRIRSKTAPFSFENEISVDGALMSRTMAVHVHYNSRSSYLPSSAKQQREMTNSALCGEREPRQLFFNFYFEFIVVLYTIFQNGRHLSILLFTCNLALEASFKEHILLNFECKNEVTRANLQLNKTIPKWRSIS